MIGRERLVEDDQRRHNKSSHDVVCLHWAHGSTKANTDAEVRLVVRQLPHITLILHRDSLVYEVIHSFKCSAGTTRQSRSHYGVTSNNRQKAVGVAGGLGVPRRVLGSFLLDPEPRCQAPYVQRHE